MLQALNRPLRWGRYLLATLLPLLAFGCAARGTAADAASFEAEGVYVRHLRVRFAPHDTKEFEALLERCVAAAADAKLPRASEWLCYREAPGRYWLLGFAAEPEGFAVDGGLEGLLAHVGASAEEGATDAWLAELAAFDYEVEWDFLCRQKTAWSTVDDMSTATHPKAHMIVRTIRPGMEEAFDAALRARTSFLAGHGYPLPIEGFVLLDGAPGQSLQVVFPRDWSSYHASESFYAFSRTCDEAMQADYARYKADLLETMARAEYYDGAHAPELSYSSI